MNRISIILVIWMISVISIASPGKGTKRFSVVYRLNAKTDSLVLVKGFSAVNSTVEFDLIPQNSYAQVGLLFRYVNENDWAYVGCDKATDNVGFAHWYIGTPEGKREIAHDISKLYAHHRRHIKVNCIGRTLTVYVDGEQIVHQYIPELSLSAGQIGFRVHDKGNVQISNVVCRSVEETVNVPAKKKSHYTLSSSCMDVLLNKDFPSVQAYIWKKDHSHLGGQLFDVKTITINGDTYRPSVTGKAEENRICYTLKIKEIAVDLQVCCEVKDNILQLYVTNIKEKGDFKVRTLAFPDHNLVSISNASPDGCLSIANNVRSDTFYLLRDKAADSTSQYGSILLLNTDKLAPRLKVILSITIASSCTDPCRYPIRSSQASGETNGFTADMTEKYCPCLTSK